MIEADHFFVETFSHPTQKEIDDLWAAEAERRVEEIRSGKVKTIPGDEVFKKIRQRLAT